MDVFCIAVTTEALAYVRKYYTQIGCRFFVYISLDTVLMALDHGQMSSRLGPCHPAVDRWFVWGSSVNNIGFTVMNGTQCLILTARDRQRTYSSVYRKTELSTNDPGH